VSVLVIPNTFITNTTINAAPFNANFTAVATAVNNIDNTNIGAAGLYASQLLPTSSAQATFGGAIGYTFLAPSTVVTPLTISGVTSQSAHILNVTLTSGGQQVAWVDQTGLLTSGAAIAFGSGSIYGSASTLYIGNDGQATQGMYFNAPSGSTNGYQFAFNNSPPSAKITTDGGVIPGNGAGVVGTAKYYSGTGVPNFSTTNGSIYMRFDGGAGTRMYINQPGASTSGNSWTAIAGS
jgi:hypothetical protein